MSAADVKARRQLAARLGDASTRGKGQSLVSRERIVVPLWIGIVQGILGWLWRGLVRLVRLVLGYPVASALVINAAVTYVRIGWTGVLVEVVALTLIGLVWSRVWPASWHRLVVVPLRSWWRWQRVYRPRWRDLMVGCGLLDAIDDHELMTQVVSLCSYPIHDEVVLSLAPGQTPSDVLESCEAITHGLGAWQVQGRTLGRGRVALVVLWSDPLIDSIRPDGQPAISGGDGPGEDPDGGGVVQMVTPDLVLSRLAAVVVGVTETGAAWAINLLPGRHTLVSGTTGAGKSGLLWAIMWSLQDLITGGWVRVTGLDPKFVELRQLEQTGLGEVVTRVPDIVDRLDELVKELDARCSEMTTRKWLPSKAFPFRIVIVDELATLTALADAASKKRVEAAMGALMSRGRAAGFVVISTTVEATKEVVRWRLLCRNRICFRSDEESTADLTLGEGSHDKGARTEEISPETPGVAYVRIEGQAGVMRVRIWEITDDHIASLIDPPASTEEGDQDQKAA